MPEKLNVAIVGVAGIARAHVPGWVASPDATLLAGCDLDEKALNTWGDLNGITPEKRYTSLDALLADKSIDIVDVCVPSNHHAATAIAALEAGKHVICEKPLAPTPADIQRMIDARDRSGKLLMTAQHMRFEGPHLAVKREIDAGRLGDIYHTRAWWLRRAELPARPGFIYKKNSGGGPCIDIGVHQLDLALWLIGNPQPVSVSAAAGCYLATQPGAFSDWGGAIAPDMDVEDFAAGFVRFADGTSLILEVSWMTHHPRQEAPLWIYGTQAGVAVHDQTIYETDNERQQRYDVKLTYTPAAHKPHAAECIAFADAVANGKPSPVPAEQSLAVQRILTALYESAEAKREVRLDG